jgi:hypothetical protein
VAEDARAAFGQWHAASLLLNMATLALATVGMGFAASLPREMNNDPPMTHQ